VRIPERLRLTLTRWQALGAVIVVLGIVIGAIGVAAYGLVAAHDWACRIGAVSTHCPAPPAPPPRVPRVDIPA
jgi:hypothetical protein